MTQQDATRCLLKGLNDAGLKYVPNCGPEKIKVLYIGNGSSQECCDLLQDISQKGLNIHSNFVFLGLKSGEMPNVYETFEAYLPQLVIIFGEIYAKPFFSTHNHESANKGIKLLSTSSPAPIIVCEDLESMTKNHALKAPCWKQLQAAKEILDG